MRRILFASAFILLVPLFAGSATPDPWADDWQTITACRQGMENIVAYLHKGTFQNKELLSTDQRDDLRNTWKSFLDYVDALDVDGDQLQQASFLVNSTMATQRYNALVYGAFLTQYRLSLEFLDELKKVPGADTLLNEAMPEWGLQKDSLAAFKFRFLNVAQAAKFAAIQMSDRWKDPGLGWEGQIKDDEKKLWAMGVSKGTAMTAENGQQILLKGIFTAWFPAQKGVSEWMGKTKVWRMDRHLISASQTRKLIKVLEPGDLLYSRHEWFVSNLGLPGFWSHAALYIGTVKERAAFFDDSDVKAWVKEQGVNGGFEDLLKSKAPKAYDGSQIPDGGEHMPRVEEAVSAGVIYSSMERFASADSLSALRPRLSKVEKARAILRAFGYAGRPYDFNFDFQSDDALVCSELVFKSYEPAKGFRGMTFPLQSMVGRVVSSPNGMVQQFDSQYGTPEQQSDLVIFLDGYEKENKAVEGGLKDYRSSWQRPKWNVFLH